jgi:adenylate kinase family enzyme
MIIFILGLPNSGKTTIGSKLKDLIENLSIYEYDNLEGNP